MITRIVVVILALVFCLTGLEVALRFYDLTRGQSFFTGQTIKPYRIFGNPVTVIDEDGQLQIRSRHGELFAIDKAPNVIRIVTFGGSTSVNKTVYAEHGFHYASILEDHVRLAVQTNASGRMAGPRKVCRNPVHPTCGQAATRAPFLAPAHNGRHDPGQT